MSWNGEVCFSRRRNVYMWRMKSAENLENDFWELFILFIHWIDDQYLQYNCTDYYALFWKHDYVWSARNL